MPNNPRHWTVTLVSLLGLGLFCAPCVSAQSIRVLLITPQEPESLSHQVLRFSEELNRSHGLLVAARNLPDADVVVQFTKYRRAFDHKGESEDWWEGQFQLLTPAPLGAQLASPPKPLVLLLIGRHEWEIAPAVELLARTLARALGREYRGIGDEIT